MSTFVIKSLCFCQLAVTYKPLERRDPLKKLSRSGWSVDISLEDCLD